VGAYLTVAIWRRYLPVNQFCFAVDRAVDTGITTTRNHPNFRVVAAEKLFSMAGDAPAPQDVDGP